MISWNPFLILLKNYTMMNAIGKLEFLIELHKFELSFSFRKPALFFGLKKPAL